MSYSSAIQQSPFILKKHQQQINDFIKDQRNSFQYQMSLLVRSNQKLTKLQDKMRSLVTRTKDSIQNNYQRTKTQQISKPNLHFSKSKIKNSNTLLTQENLIHNQQQFQQEKEWKKFNNVSQAKKQHNLSQQKINTNNSLNAKKSLKIFPKRTTSLAHVHTNVKQINHEGDSSKCLNQKSDIQNFHNKKNTINMGLFQKQYRFQLIQQIQAVQQMMRKCVGLKEQKMQQLACEIERQKEQNYLLYKKNQLLEKQLKQVLQSSSQPNYKQIGPQIQQQQQEQKRKQLSILNNQQKKLQKQRKSLKFEVKSMQRHLSNILKNQNNKITNYLQQKKRKKSSKSIRNCCSILEKNTVSSKKITQCKKKCERTILKSLVDQLNKIKGLVQNQIVRCKSKSQISYR